MYVNIERNPIYLKKLIHFFFLGKRKKRGCICPMCRQWKGIRKQLCFQSQHQPPVCHRNCECQPSGNACLLQRQVYGHICHSLLWNIGHGVCCKSAFQRISNESDIEYQDWSKFQCDLWNMFNYSNSNGYDKPYFSTARVFRLDSYCQECVELECPCNGSLVALVIQPDTVCRRLVLPFRKKPWAVSCIRSYTRSTPLPLAYCLTTCNMAFLKAPFWARSCLWCQLTPFLTPRLVTFSCTLTSQPCLQVIMMSCCIRNVLKI